MARKISLEYFQNFMTLGQVHVSVWENALLESSFAIKPEEFLNYAKDDLSSNVAHKSVNALSNVKRALSCQIDLLLIEFGLYEAAKKGKWSLPKEVEILGEIGLVLPVVLTNINQKRNLLEHKYKNPTREEVEDALGAVELFLAYTKKFTEKPLGELCLFNDHLNEELELMLDYKKKALVFFEHVYTGKKIKKKIIKSVEMGSSDYLNYLKLYVGIYLLF